MNIRQQRELVESAKFNRQQAKAATDTAAKIALLRAARADYRDAAQAADGAMYIGLAAQLQAEINSLILSN